MNQDQKKRLAAEAALPYLTHGMTLGVGTGSTVDHFIDALRARADLLAAVCSSSDASTQKLRNAGISVSDLNTLGDLDLYVDGADEATEHLYLTKGGGGALTREKVLAGASRRFICIIDDSKLVDVLGGFPLPIEVIPLARAYVARQLVKVGGKPVWRQGCTTDNGNEILDVHDLDIVDPPEMELRLNQIPGIVSVGLFARRPADLLLVAGDRGVTAIE